MGHARLPASKGNKSIFPLVEVKEDFQWYFQKFDIKWKDKNKKQQSAISVELGKVTEVKSVRGGLSRPITGHDGSYKDVYETNLGKQFNGAQHIDYGDIVDAIKNNLSKFGFEDLEEIISP